MPSSQTVDSYDTVRDEHRIEIKVKGSRFIATVAPATTKEAASQFIESMRKEFYDATHNCFAWRFGPLGVEKRAADDGEPSGSAGKPILTALEKHDVLDAVVVVTRYFGGTKLGVGGLQRAYGDAAEQCLAEVERRVVHLTRAVRIDCNYEDISLLKRMMDGTVVSCEEEYDTAAHFIAQLPQSQAQDFADQVLAATHARAEVSVDD